MLERHPATQRKEVIEKNNPLGTWNTKHTYRHVLYVLPLVNLDMSFSDSIVVSIPACHAGDLGSIPSQRETLFQVLFFCTNTFCIGLLHFTFYHLNKSIRSCVVIDNDKSLFCIDRYWYCTNIVTHTVRQLVLQRSSCPASRLSFDDEIL